MDLNSIHLPNDNWCVKDKYIMFKKLHNIPVCYIYDGIVYVFLDARIAKEIIRFTKYLIKNELGFYFTTPLASDPKGVENLDQEIIRSYLIAHSNSAFFYGFKKIGFNLIENMVQWAKYSKTNHLIKPMYDIVNDRVQKSQWNYYQNRELYLQEDIEIRNEFSSLYREIKILQIFG